MIVCFAYVQYDTMDQRRFQEPGPGFHGAGYPIGMFAQNLNRGIMSARRAFPGSLSWAVGLGNHAHFAL
jgi:hypothetical protein